MNLNKVFVLGRLTADPQLKTLPSGQSVVNFSIATNRVWKNKEGQSQTSVEYHNIVAWARQAEIISQFLNKGSLVLIEGRLQTRSFVNRDGQNQKRTEIVCERLQLGPRLSSARDGVNPAGDGASPARDENKGNLPEIELEEESKEEEIKPEDLPF